MSVVYGVLIYFQNLVSILIQEKFLFFPQMFIDH